MGYDLHITRKKFWFDDDGKKISYDEWINYVANDPDIFQDKNNTEGYFSFNRTGGDWIFYHDDTLGEIRAKNPPADVIIKMVKMSKALKAKVQGDDHELYVMNGNTYKQQNNESSSTDHKGSSPYDRYARYFFAAIFVASIIWHIVYP